MSPTIKQQGYRWCGLEIAQRGSPPTILVSDAKLVVKAYKDLSLQSHQDYTRTFTDCCRLVSQDFDRLIETTLKQLNQ